MCVQSLCRFSKIDSNVAVLVSQGIHRIGPSNHIGEEPVEAGIDRGEFQRGRIAVCQ